MFEPARPPVPALVGAAGTRGAPFWARPPSSDIDILIFNN